MQQNEHNVAITFSLVASTAAAEREISAAPAFRSARRDTIRTLRSASCERHRTHRSRQSAIAVGRRHITAPSCGITRLYIGHN